MNNLQFDKMSKRKQTSLDVLSKHQILTEVDRGVLSKKAIAEKYKIPKSTLSTILKNREKIEEAIASGSVNSRAKRLRTAKHEDIESRLLTWFNHMRAENIPLSGPLIKEKALEIAENLGITDFECSNGWLWRFQQRFRISSQKVCGEANKVDEETANEWISEFEENSKNYHPRDKYNLDETGLFFNLLPDRTLSVKGEKCHGGTRSKQRLTVVLACNSDGSHKLRPWVIGKFGKPHCFVRNRIDVEALPCKYTFHNNSWMDSKAFRTWLLEFNKEMAKKNRHVLLTLDNFSGHNVKGLNLSNVKVQFFPANFTSRLQPLDQGIIKVFKQHFRTRLVRAAIAEIEKNRSMPKWTVLDAIRATAGAWNNVTPENIAKCFQKAWTRSDEATQTIAEDETVPVPAEWETLQSLTNVRLFLINLQLIYV